MDDNWLTDWLTDLLIDYKIIITKSVIIPAVSGLYRPTGLLFSFCSWFFINCIFWLKAKLHVSIYCCVNISMKSFPCVYLGPIFQRIHEHHNPNLVKFHTVLAWKMMIRSGHNVAHATTAQLLWHVQNCDLIASLKLQLMQRLISLYFIYELCFHKILIMGS